MHTLTLLLVAAASCATAHPGPTMAPLQAPQLGPQRMPLPREFRGGYIVPRIILPSYLKFEERPPIRPVMQESDWLTKEIDHINQMEDEVDTVNSDETGYLPQWLAPEMFRQQSYPMSLSLPFAPESIRLKPDYEAEQPMAAMPSLLVTRPENINRVPVFNDVARRNDETKKKFAFTPLDKEYYESRDNPPVKMKPETETANQQELEEPKIAMLLEPPRQTRQNPNLSKQKHLLDSDLGKKTGISHDDHEVTDKPRHIHVMETQPDPSESIYGVALFAAVGAVLAVAIFGFGVGWYNLSKRAKAAADVDYPAYGVTGPNMDASEDRKLAHSAHMYHYQHQKQQIIAMERNGLEHRAGSVSDPESEEENEEGDYTVYECPGFATTGDMEVKNPLFTEDPTLTTPGKCEVVKPQPKE